MSQDDSRRDTAAPEGAPSTTPRPVRAQPARTAHGSSTALALLLAVLALVGTGYVGWHQWRQEQGRRASVQAEAALQQRVSALEHTLAGISSNGSTLQQRLADAEQANQTVRVTLQQQNDRLCALEDAVGQLSEKTMSGRDAMLLDDTESLLRLGQQRYELFHDARGAAAAYGLAEQSLAAVNNQDFAGVRQSIEAERSALLQSDPVARGVMLDTLVQLRDTSGSLPLKPLDDDSRPATGAWARIGRALASVVSIHRDDSGPLTMAGAGLSRELLALDLAQAQADLLAGDTAGAGTAMKQADARLAASFDPQADAVQQARAQLAHLIGELKPTVPVALGAALNQLRNLRAMYALSSAAPASASSAPANASSAPASASSSHGAMP